MKRRTGDSRRATGPNAPVDVIGLRRSNRRATAAVECAVCMPLIVMLVFAAMELCNMIFLKEALQTSAYEAARTAVAGDKKNTANKVGRNLLKQRNVKQGRISTDPSNPSKIDTGEMITVTATAPISRNRFTPEWFFGGGNLSAKCAMMKE